MSQRDNVYVENVKAYGKQNGIEVVVICAKIEEELSVLDVTNRALLMEDYGIKETGLNQLIKNHMPY